MKKVNLSIFGVLIAALWLIFGATVFVSRAEQTQLVSNGKQSPSQTPTSANNKQIPSPGVKSTPTPTPGDDSDEVIKVENDLVNLSVRVVDRNGHIVSDVRPEEFKVFEDGVPQKVDFVSKEDVPINYGLVVDNLGSMRFQIDKVIDAGKIIVAANKPDDATFIVRFVSSDKIEEKQPFTKNKQDLNDALEEMHLDPGQTAIIDAVMLASEKASEYEKNKRAEDKSRRALVLITDGEDRVSFYKEEELFRQLREADVQIYPIGFVNELSKEDGGIIKKSSRSKAIKLLERMAQETGGKAYFPNSLDELPDIARSINNELRTQFSIGYVPTNDKRDGTFRAIKVVINEDVKRGHRIPITKTGRTAPKS